MSELISKAAKSRPVVSLRRQRPGPEWELVQWLVDRKHFKVPRGCKVVTFCEPRLVSGFPDLVIVILRTAPTLRWNPLRSKLTSEDIRLVHYISSVGKCTIAQLLRAGFKKGLSLSLRRLSEAAVIRHVRDSWIAKPLSRNYAVHKIIAVEAKITNWASALRQAQLNTWFASDSYVLIPSVPPRSGLIKEAYSKGIGVLIQEKPIVEVCPPISRKLPCSYASWLFNEWAWRATLRDLDFVERKLWP